MSDSVKEDQAKHPFRQGNRLLALISLALGFITWVVFAMVNGDTRDQTVHNVPVHIEMTGTVAGDLGLKTFFPTASSAENITVSVVVHAKRYDTIAKEDLNAQLMVSDVDRAGDYNLGVRITPAKAGDTRFEIRSYSVGGVEGHTTIAVGFDYERTLSFELSPVINGAVTVPDGYYAGDVMLTKKFVSITGPQRKIAEIAGVKAEIMASGLLKETTTFEGDGVRITPVDAAGNAVPQFLTIDGGGDLKATLPVWKQATLRTTIDFLHVPQAYLSQPLPFRMKPESVRAALDEERANIAQEQGYAVGTIDFAALAPNRNAVTFQAAELTQIAFLDSTSEITATVDLTGFSTRTMTLPGGNIEVDSAPDAPGYEGTFSSVRNVVVVGPEESLASLTAERLSGKAMVDSSASAGRAILPVTIAVDSDDCWVYGTDYKANGTLRES
ncbi:MAG: hypothetical protein LBG83_02095 [Oscillospiraceae bacterium]|jgi:hypothetical protein|nr:hypothetical protein [Oscillospiraceae bacterium]